MAALDDAIAAAAKLAKNARRFDEVFEAELAVAKHAEAGRVTFNQKKLQAIMERETELENARKAGTVQVVDYSVTAKEADQLRKELAVSQEVTRKAAVSDPLADVDYRHQTNGPEEFKARMPQLRDEEYASRAVLRIPGSANPGPRAREVAHGLAIDAEFQKLVSKTRASDPRQVERLKAIAGDTPYVTLDGTPQVMVHVDRMTDPTRTTIDEGFIQQLDEAYEVGLHSGTNVAAMRATIRNVDSARVQIQSLDDTVAELDGIASMDGALQSKFAQALDAYFYQKFSRGEGIARDGTVFDEFKEFAVVALQRMNLEGEEIAEQLRFFLTGMRELPLASSTPHYFLGKNGLLLQDVGGWKPQNVYDQLVDIFPDHFDELSAAYGNALGQSEKTVVVRKFIEDRGYDHIVYHNTVEDIGSLSVIHWKPEQMMSIMDPRVTGGTARGNATAMTSYIMGGVFSGASIRNRE